MSERPKHLDPAFLRKREAGFNTVIQQLPNTPIEANVGRIKTIAPPELERKKAALRKKFDAGLPRALQSLEEQRKVVASRAVKESMRDETAQKFLQKVVETRSLIEGNILDVSFFNDALREYKRNMKQYGLSDLLEEVSSPKMTKERLSSQKPSLFIDSDQKVAKINNEIIKIDELTIDALKLFIDDEVEFVGTREFGDLAKSHGIKGNYPAGVIYKRFANIFEDHPNILEEYVGRQGKMFKLNADLKFGDLEGAKATKQPKDQKEPRDEGAVFAGLDRTRLAAIDTLISNPNIGIYELADILGPSRAGRKLTWPQAKASLNNSVRLLFARTTNNSANEEEKATFESINALGPDISKESLYQLIDASVGRVVPGRGEMSGEDQGVSVSSSQNVIAEAEIAKQPSSIEGEAGSPINYDGHDLAIFSNLILWRMGTDIKDFNSITLYRFTVPADIVFAAQKLERSMPKESLSGTELISRRNAVIDSVSAMVKSGNMSLLANKEPQARELFSWVMNFVQDKEMLRNNFSEFLGKYIQRDRNNRKYLIIENPSLGEEDKPQLGTEVAITPEDEEGIVKLDGSDVKIITGLFLTRKDSYIRNGDGRELYKIVFDIDVVNKMSELWNKLGYLNVPQDVLREMRARSIQKMESLLNDDVLVDYSALGEDAKKAEDVIEWLNDYLEERPLVKLNIDQFLNKLPMSAPHGEKYINIDEYNYLKIGKSRGSSIEILDNEDSIDVAESNSFEEVSASEDDSKTIETQLFEEESVDVGDSTFPVEDKRIDVTPNPLVSPRFEKDPWEAFKRRDSQIEDRIRAIAEEIKALGAEPINTARIVSQLPGVTDRNLDLVIKNKIINPALDGKGSARRVLTYIDAVKFAYFSRYGRAASSLGPRDYSKLTANIEQELEYLDKQSKFSKK